MTDRPPKSRGSSQPPDLDAEKRRLKAIVDKVIASSEVQEAIWLAEGYKKGGPNSFVVRARDPALELRWTAEDEAAFRTLFGHGTSDPEPN